MIDGILGRGRQQRQREAQEAVRPHLQQYAGQYDGPRGGRFGVRVRQPRMEREHRYLDGEPDEERPEHPPLHAVGNLRPHEVRDIEAVRLELRVVLIVQSEDAEEHQHAADQRVDHELDGGIAAPRTAPDADDEVHGHQHGLPEDEEEQKIQRHEDAQHAGLQEQEEGVVFLQPVFNGVPTRKNCQHADDGGQHHQQQAQPVDADVVGGAQRGNPLRPFFELVVLRVVEVEYQRQGNQEADERDGVGPQFDGARVRGRKEQQHQ